MFPESRGRKLLPLSSLDARAQRKFQRRIRLNTMPILNQERVNRNVQDDAGIGLIAGTMRSTVLSVAKQFRVMNKQMRFVLLLAFSSGSIFSGCRTAHDVAVTSFHVIDAPAAYVRRRVDESDRTSTTTTTRTTADSDVVAPGRVINAAPSNAENRTVSRSRPRSASNAPSSGSDTETVRTEPKPSPSRSPRVTTSQLSAQVPTAKPVPGKAGYVVSPFDPNGGYVDVTGYKPGDKVKDPYSKKIFLVP